MEDGARAVAVHWSEAVAEAICGRIAAGESLRSVCRDEGAPALQTVMRWAREKPSFWAALDAARAAAGRPFRAGGVSSYCQETADAVFDRLAAGEGMAAVCRDPDMPALSTVKKWMRDVPAFKAAVDVARDCQADHFFEKGWEIASAITPKTALAAKVQLGHLRWHAAKLAPKTYGAHKAVDGATIDRRKILHVWTKKYVFDGPDDQQGRWSEEPSEHKYSMVAVDSPVDAGERLPHPGYVHEPRACQPGGDRLARGGSIEAEYEGEED